MSSSAIPQPPAAAPQLAVGPAVWTRREAEADPSWRVHLTDVQRREVLQAVEAWRAQELAGLPRGADALARLPSFSQLIAQVKREVGGRGFMLVRGLPLDHMSDEDAARGFWALGTMIGSGVTQNAAADLLCPVTDKNVSFDYGDRTVQNARLSE